MIAAATFKALGDPVRLTMIERLSNHSTYTLGALSDGLNLTRQGARKHLQILVDAGLVVLRPHGRQTVVELQPASLRAAQDFIAELEQRWDTRLEALRTYVEQNPS